MLGPDGTRSRRRDDRVSDSWGQVCARAEPRGPSPSRTKRSIETRRTYLRVGDELPLTSGHRRKPGTRGFTSDEFKPHLAHLLVSSSLVDVIVNPERSLGSSSIRKNRPKTCGDTRSAHRRSNRAMSARSSHTRSSFRLNDMHMQATRKRVTASRRVVPLGVMPIGTMR